jgi:transposase-like protein
VQRRLRRALGGADQHRRNGYRERVWDTRVGTIELAIPKLRQGSYFPEWLLERRRRAERALIAVVAECCLLGVSTRRVENLVNTLGIERISKSQVSEMARSLDAIVESFRNRPLDQAPYRYLWLDALALRSRENGIKDQPGRIELDPPGPGATAVSDYLDAGVFTLEVERSAVGP